MNTAIKNVKKTAVMLVLVLIALIVGRGLISGKPMAGHDASAYPVNQAQFMENLRDGVVFPRWSPDTRLGYGQPQLQFRPPLLHYLAAPIHAATGNPFLALHIALLFSLFLAAWGAFSLARLRTGTWPALAAAAGFVCANYMLSNLYLRGAYYEVLASAAMPWILWAQCRENFSSRRAFLIGPAAWAAMLMGHPAVAFLFLPLAIAHALSEAVYVRCWRILAFSLISLGTGILLSAPYTWVMLAEGKWVRMEIFLYDLNSWRRHFLSLRELFTERWPATCAQFNGVDYLKRALPPEMRGLNFWAFAIIMLTPLVLVVAFWKRRRDKSGLQQLTTDYTDDTDSDRIRAVHEIRGHDSVSAEKLFYAVFFYAAAWISAALSLRLSLPLWDHIPLMETFNYPWRVLNVTGLCLALSAAYGISSLADLAKKRMVGVCLAALFILAPLLEAVPHSGGRQGPAWPARNAAHSAVGGLTQEALTPEKIRRHAGIPQQFYTPTWVRGYPPEPAQADAFVAEGEGKVTVIERRTAHWRLRAETKTPARIALSHYYYPGWRIYWPDGAIMETEPWGENGLISFIVPAGNHTLEARFGSTPARRLANFAFFAGMALMLLGVSIKSGSNLTLILNKVDPDAAGSSRKATARPLRGRTSLCAFVFSVGSVILLIGAILLSEYLANSRDDEARTVQAGRQLAEGDNLAAIRSFAKLLRERETDIAARYNLGAAYHNYGWHDEALSCYDNVLSLANEYAARAAHSMARIYVARQDVENARRCYEEALRHRPDAKDIREEYERLLLPSRSSGAATKFEYRNKFK